MNKLYLLFGIVFLLSIGYAEGVCVTPVENLTIVTNNSANNYFNICVNSSLFLPDNSSTGIGAIVIANNNPIWINFTGTNMYGNGSGVAIFWQGYGNKKNVHIIGGNFSNYSRIIESYGENTTVQDSLFGCTSSLQALYLSGLSPTILNNTFYCDNYNDDPIYILKQNATIINNVQSSSSMSKFDKYFINLKENYAFVENNTANSLILFSVSSNGSIIRNNIARGHKNTTSYSGMGVVSGNYNTISRNSQSNGISTLYVSGNNNNITNNNFYNNSRVFTLSITSTAHGNYIYNNTINLTDIGIYTLGSNNIYDSNKLYDVKTDVDAWDLGFYVLSTNNETFTNNLLDNIMSGGVFFSNSSNMRFYNNTINMMSITNKLLNGKEDHGEPSCAICVNEIYKNYYGGIFPIANANQSTLYQYHSENISIADNIFGNDTQTFLLIQDGVNITHDMTDYDYWYRSFGVPYYIRNIEFYNNNLFDYIYQIFGTQRADLHIALMYWRYCDNSNSQVCDVTHNVSNSKWNYSMSKTLINFTNNINFSNNVSIFSASSFYPFNDIKNTSNGVILASNVDNYSITLSPGQQIEVGDFITDYCSSNVKMVCDYNNICRDIITGCVVNDSNTRSTIVWCANE